MVSFLAALALQASTGSVWFVGPFVNPPDRSSNLERTAHGAILSALKALRAFTVNDGSWDRNAVSQAAGRPDATVYRGAVGAVRLRKTRHGRSASVSLRAVAYDIVSGEVVSDVTAVGEALGEPGASDADLAAMSVQKAAERAVKETQDHRIPSGTLLNTTVNEPLLNRGRRDGYRVGTPVAVTRGRLLVGIAHISIVEDDQAELAFDRAALDFAPGDHVRALRAKA